MDEVISLREDITRTNNPHEKLELMFKLVQLYWRTDQQKMPDILKEMIELAQLHDNLEMLLQGMWYMGSWYRSVLKPELAVTHFNEALAIAVEIGKSDLQSRILNSLGAVHHNASKFSEAISYFEQSRALANECSDVESEAISVLNIGACRHNLGQYSEAMQYYLEAQKLFEKSKGAAPPSVLRIMGGLAMEIGNSETAIKYFLQALHNLEVKENHREKAPLLSDMGSAYLTRGEYEKSLRSYEEALPLSELAGDGYQTVILHCMMSSLFFETGAFKKGWDALEKARQQLTGSQSALLESMIFHFEGVGYKAEKEFLKARISIEKCLAIALEIGNTKMICAALLLKGMALEEQSQHEEAILTLNELIEKAETQHYKGEEYYKACEALCRIHESLYDFQNATIHYKKFYEIKKEQSKLQSEFTTAAMLVEFETKKTQQQAEIYRLKNVELAEANEQLVVMSNERKEFISIAAHDLKNPLFAIKMLVDSTRSSNPHIPPHVVEALADIESASGGMLELVQNLLDTEAIETGKLQFNKQDFKASESVFTIIERYRDAMLLKTLSIHTEIDEDIMIFNDQRYFLQVIDNLLSNAVKYSPFKKNIFVRLFKNPENGKMRLEIQDEGPGISADDMTKLFGKFQRLSARPTGNEHSTGLGLAIVKMLVEAMDGQIFCESEIGTGSIFIVEMTAV
ncbi:MAG: tetratricopeptide repeat protein [Bacteroidota bacterium]